MRIIIGRDAPVPCKSQNAVTAYLALEQNIVIYYFIQRPCVCRSTTWRASRDGPPLPAYQTGTNRHELFPPCHTSSHPNSTSAIYNAATCRESPSRQH